MDLDHFWLYVFRSGKSAADVFKDDRKMKDVKRIKEKLLDKVCFMLTG